MTRIKEYYLGKPCKMDIGADGISKFAVGRLGGVGEGATMIDAFQHPSIVIFVTPHGSAFETGFFHLYELSESDWDDLLAYEDHAKSHNEWYGNRLNDVSHDIMKKEE